MLMAPRTATAAVAIIKSLTPSECFLILRRASHPQDPWSGHFSFPGGRKEKEDKDLVTTCIRETEEETGIRLNINQLQEKLPLEPAGRNFSSPLWVQPYIFELSRPISLHLNKKEIKSSSWLDIKAFKNIQHHLQVEMLPDRYYPAYPLEDYYIWGFTYRLLCSVLHMNESQK